MKTLRQIIRALLGGLMIGAGGTVYLSTPDPIPGAFLFGVGLFVICVFRFSLFTGITGYILDGKIAENLKNAITVWLGNFMGCLAFALLLRCSGNLSELAEIAVAAKLSRPLWYGFCTAIPCGALMYIAVDNYNKNDSPLGKYLGIFLCVPAFILSGMEHSIADMFFLSAAYGMGIFSLQTLTFLLIMTGGNLIGGLCFAKLRAFATDKK